jgi:DNA-binding NarL/FixJ family response regulator
MAADTPISVLCVDDNPLVTDAVAAKLRAAGGFAWLGCLPSADDLVGAAERLKPAIILLDVDMPGADPFEAVRALVEGGSASRVIMFSGHVRADLLERAIGSGAWGYVSKCDGEDAMLEGIRSVARGEFALSPEALAVCERG